MGGVNRISAIERIPRKRAIQEKDKLTKRSNLIQAAANLLLRKDLNDLSMDDVAKKAKVAKGTLYLYFPTKEDLVLRVHILDYQVWFEDLNQSLDTVGNKDFLFAEWFIHSVEKHNRFIKILPIVPTILEKHASFETIKEYKQEILALLTKIIPKLTIKLGINREEDTFLFMMQCHAIAIGSWSHGFPSNTVKQVLDEKSLQVFKINYIQFVKSTIEILLKGYKETNSK